MKKEEIIAKVYGEYWEKLKGYVDKDGWCNNLDLIGTFGIFDLIGVDRQYPSYWRPKELRGIENNNGWIKIETKEQFNEIPNGNYHWFNINTWEYEAGDIPVNKYTHYQPIINPEPPIY